MKPKSLTLGRQTGAKRISSRLVLAFALAFAAHEAKANTLALKPGSPALLAEISTSSGHTEAICRVPDDVSTLLLLASGVLTFLVVKRRSDA